MNLRGRTKASGLDRLTSWLLAVAFSLSVLHITDHVLRVDHSGWPFRREVTPFTFSLLALPMVLFAILGSRRLYWWRWSLLVIATAATLYAHTAIETPQMQFAMWAHDSSSDPRQQGLHNIPEVKSPLLGVLSMAIGMTLNVVACLSSIAMLVGGLRSPHLGLTQ